MNYLLKLVIPSLLAMSILGCTTTPEKDFVVKAGDTKEVTRSEIVGVDPELLRPCADVEGSVEDYGSLKVYNVLLIEKMIECNNRLEIIRQEFSNNGN